MRMMNNSIYTDAKFTTLKSLARNSGHNLIIENIINFQYDKNGKVVRIYEIFVFLPISPLIKRLYSPGKNKTINSAKMRIN